MSESFNICDEGKLDKYLLGGNNVFVASCHNFSVQKLRFGEKESFCINPKAHSKKAYHVASLTKRRGYFSSGEDHMVNFFSESEPFEPYFHFKTSREVKDMIFFRKGEGWKMPLIVADYSDLVVYDIGKDENKSKIVWKTPNDHHTGRIKRIVQSEIRPNSILAACFDSSASEIDIEKQKVVNKGKIGNLCWSIAHMKEDNVTCIGTGGFYLYSSDLQKRICKLQTQGGCDIPTEHLPDGHYCYTSDDSGSLYCHDMRSATKLVHMKKICRAWVTNIKWVKTENNTSKKLICASCGDLNVRFIEVDNIEANTIWTTKLRKTTNNSENEVSSVCQIMESHHSSNQKMMEFDRNERILYIKDNICDIDIAQFRIISDSGILFCFRSLLLSV